MDNASGTQTADDFLLALKADPIALDSAPVGDIAAMIEHRRHEVHSCYRCGGPAGCAYIAHTPIGPRWLDLCPACSNWLIINAPDDWADNG